MTACDSICFVDTCGGTARFLMNVLVLPESNKHKPNKDMGTLFRKGTLSVPSSKWSIVSVFSELVL